MKERELNSADYPLHWRQLQQVGLNAYEARSYLVLMGHPRFKALELAARAHVPRQKIYEVLDSLVEKGFAQVVQEKTKLFSAVDPALSIPGFLARRSRMLQNELAMRGPERGLQRRPEWKRGARLPKPGQRSDANWYSLPKNAEGFGYYLR